MKTFCCQVLSDSPYPVETKTLAECTSESVAASRAVKEHIAFLRKTNRLRKRGDSMTIKIQKGNEI